MKKKTVLILIGLVLIVCCIVALVLVFVFKDTLFRFISPTITPTPTTSVIVTPTITVAATNVTGTWSGSYTVSYPKACSASGAWTANLLEQNGTLTGSFSSDVGFGGNVTGSVSGSEINWEVGGTGGVTFEGNIVETSVGGRFTGPPCGGSAYTSGAFTGNKE